MQVERVFLSSDIFRGLLAHSFITDQEEVLGLLFGSFTSSAVNVWGSLNVKRNCKEKDRVEVEDVQLSSAMDKAEILSNEIRQQSNLIGWFHSHPNITVFPSHVDLRTQLSLQNLGSHFIGLIISCFSRDSSNLEKISLLAFQTNPVTNNAISIPVTIVSTLRLLSEPQCMKSFDSLDYLLTVQKNLLEEEGLAYQEAMKDVEGLAQVCNSSLFSLAVARILQKSLIPMDEFLRQKKEIDGIRLAHLLEENQELERKIKERDERKENCIDR